MNLPNRIPTTPLNQTKLDSNPMDPLPHAELPFDPAYHQDLIPSLPLPQEAAIQSSVPIMHPHQPQSIVGVASVGGGGKTSMQLLQSIGSILHLQIY